MVRYLPPRAFQSAHPENNPPGDDVCDACAFAHEVDHLAARAVSEQAITRAVLSAIDKAGAPSLRAICRSMADDIMSAEGSAGIALSTLAFQDLDELTLDAWLHEIADAVTHPNLGEQHLAAAVRSLAKRVLARAIEREATSFAELRAALAQPDDH